MKHWVTYLLLIALSACSRNSEPHKIFYINSYHQGYKPSDDIRAGIDQVLDGKNVVFKAAYLDTKRLGESEISQKAKEVLNEIETFEPDILLTCDDNAIKYIVEPHFKNADIPVLFCGVNWTCDQYGLPTDNIRGMLEVLPVEATIDTLKKYFPRARRLAVLSENTTSEQKNQTTLQSIFRAGGFVTEYRRVDGFAAWMAAFQELNKTADAIFLPTNGAIKNWNADSAKAFVHRYAQVPVFTCDDFMMTYAAFGLTKIAREQGEWVAQQALAVLEGVPITSVEMTANQTYEAWINPILAEKVGFQPKEPLRYKISPHLDDLVP